MNRHDSNQPTQPEAAESVNLARRRLLKAGAYAAPLVVGALAASSAEGKVGTPCTPASPPACSCTPTGVGTPDCP